MLVSCGSLTQPSVMWSKVVMLLLHKMHSVIY